MEPPGPGPGGWRQMLCGLFPAVSKDLLSSFDETLLSHLTSPSLCFLICKMVVSPDRDALGAHQTHGPGREKCPSM